MLKNIINSLWEKIPTKSVKQSESIIYQRKTFDTVDIKSIITENPKNLV